MRKNALLLTLVLLTSCATPTPPPEPHVLTIHATSATQPWLDEAYRCASTLAVPPDGAPLALLRVADPYTAEIRLRLASPSHLTSPSYVIGETRLEIIVHARNPVAALNAGQVSALFGGRERDWAAVGGESGEVRVWVYARGTDSQEAFRAAALGGGPVTSLARQAAGPEAMLEAIAGDRNAIGFLPRPWLTDDVRPLSLPEDLERALTTPVIAITPEEPQGAARALLACLQGLTGEG